MGIASEHLTRLARLYREADKENAERSRVTQTKEDGMKDIMTLGKVLKFKEREMEKDERYWVGTLGGEDDFGEPLDDVFYDGATRRGPWAIMSPRSWRLYGVGQTGTGRAQKYEKQADGRWLKTEG